MIGRSLTLSGYAVILAAALVWQVVSARRGSLTLGRLLRWLAQRRVGLVLLLLAWAWVGWHLFARGTATFLSR